MSQLQLIQRGNRYQTELRYALSEESIFDAAKRGLTLKDIGRALGCSGPTIRTVLEENENFRIAWERGHAELLGELVNHLVERAFVNDICLLFLLKSRFEFCEHQYVLGKEPKDDGPRVVVHLPDNGRDNNQQQDLAETPVIITEV